MKRLNVGVIGLGRLGRVYARDLAGRIPETRLVAVADPMGNLAKEIAEEFDVPKSYTDPLAMIDDTNVEAIVIVTPTHIHRQQVIAAAKSKKPDAIVDATLAMLRTPLVCAEAKARVHANVASACKAKEELGELLPEIA